RIWQGSGTRRRTVSCAPKMSPRTATRRFGGNANPGMSGKQPSATGHWEGAAPIVRIGKLTNPIVLLRPIHNWSQNGIRRGTVIFDQKTSRPATEGKSGGYVLRRRTMSGRPE